MAIMRWPVFWGTLASIAFYATIHFGFISNELVRRYFANHPVEYIATTMFFVGLAALLIKFADLYQQPASTEESLLGPIPTGGNKVEECGTLLARLDAAGASVRNSYLGRRLQDAIETIARKKTAAGYEEHLRHLSDTEHARSHSSYALVRIVISTIPILGFLGTVIGITVAVAELAQVVGEVSFDEAINSVVSGLSVAFDTTALALALSIVLMFAMFFATRLENNLLEVADRQADDELIGRFAEVDTAGDPSVQLIQHIASEVVRSTERLVHRQAELWTESMDAANERWQSLAITAEKQLETALSKALRSSYDTHSQQLKEADKMATQQAMAGLSAAHSLLNTRLATEGAAPVQPATNVTNRPGHAA